MKYSLPLFSRRCALLVSAGCLCLSSAWAQQTDFGAHVPTAEEFITGLKLQPRMRGIKPATTATTPRVSMELRFAFNSFELTDESKASLNNLSTALKSQELGVYTFMIEGHTDAIGTEDYNQSLSQKRAHAVMDYLVRQHGIDAQRLRVVGKGEQDLLDPKQPTAAVNRRVAIVNLGDQ